MSTGGSACSPVLDANGWVHPAQRWLGQLRMSPPGSITLSAHAFGQSGGVWANPVVEPMEYSRKLLHFKRLRGPTRKKVTSNLTPNVKTTASICMEPQECTG